MNSSYRLTKYQIDIVSKITPVLDYPHPHRNARVNWSMTTTILTSRTPTPNLPGPPQPTEMSEHRIGKGLFFSSVLLWPEKGHMVSQ